MSQSGHPEPAPKGPTAPVGVNHLVLNVSDLERAHRFWTEILGFHQVGQIEPPAGRPGMRMRFYCGSQGRHHDLALAEVKSDDSDREGAGLFSSRVGLNHVAIAYPDRESWLNQLRYMRAKEIPFRLRMQHGTTHSLYVRDPDGHAVEVLYELPRERWEGDLNAALNYAKILPTEGEAALADDVDTPVFDGTVPGTIQRA